MIGLRDWSDIAAQRNRTGAGPERGLEVTAQREKVIIYTLPECDVSERALAGLRAEGVEVEERNVMRDKQWFEEALRISIFVPIVIRGEKVEIGWKGAYG